MKTRNIKHQPILFSTPMVKAIMNGSKTQTRRIIKSPEILTEYEGVLENSQFPFWKDEMLGKHLFHTEHGEHLVRPKAEVGDIFWVRETFRDNIESFGYLYRASTKETLFNQAKWMPSIFMPKEACRLFLKCTNVRVEKLNFISETDAIAEGIEKSGDKWRNYFSKEPQKNTVQPISSFCSLWESINGVNSWQKNPFVFVYDFELTEKPKNFI